MDTTTSKSCDVDLFFCSPPIPLALCVCSDDRLLKLTEPVYFNHYLIYYTNNKHGVLKIYSKSTVCYFIDYTVADCTRASKTTLIIFIHK